VACLSVLAEFGVVVSLANPHRSAGEFGYSAIRERRLIEINRRLSFMSSPEACDEVVPELDAEEVDALYEERDLLLKELDEDVD